jgi:hypothetical protein
MGLDAALDQFWEAADARQLGIDMPFVSAWTIPYWHICQNWPIRRRRAARR